MMFSLSIDLLYLLLVLIVTGNKTVKYIQSGYYIMVLPSGGPNPKLSGSRQTVRLLD